MIDVRELKIGSWVIDTIAHEPVQIIALDKRGGEYYDPIPLTKEILINCGWHSGNYISEMGEYLKENANGFTETFSLILYNESAIHLGLKDDVYYLTHIGANYNEEEEIYQISYFPIAYLHRFQDMVKIISGTDITYKP